MALSKKDKEIYLRAAERIVIKLSDHACCAISSVANEIEGGGYYTRHPLRIKFAEYFQPEPRFVGGGWFGDYTEENQLARSLALLSMLYCEE